MYTRCLFLMVGFWFTGCTMHITESDTEHIVSSAFETRHSAKPYRMTCVSTDKSGTGANAVEYTVERDKNNSYRYIFSDGASYWNTDDGFVLINSSASCVEIFRGIVALPEAELRTMLRQATKHWLSLNTVTVNISDSEQDWRGYRCYSSPKTPRPLMPKTESFVDKATSSMVLYREFGETDDIQREVRAIDVHSLNSDYRVAGNIPDGFVQVVFQFGLSREPLSSWAIQPQEGADSLSTPKGTSADGIISYDLGQKGFTFLVFERLASEKAFVSPVAKVFHVDDISVKYWWIGEKIIFRWQQRGIEWTIVTTMPPDMVFEYIKKSILAFQDSKRPGT